MTTRAGIYVRISVDREHELSTEVQVSACRSYAEAKGWQVAAVEEERGRSAYKRKVRRPGLDRLLAGIDDGSLDVLLVYRLDRVTRSVIDFARLWERLAANDAGFASVSEQFDTTTAMGRAMVQVAAVFAELESAIKGERIKDWHETRIANGVPPTGPRPFGYQKGRVIDPAEAPMVRDAAARVLAGESLRSICTRWNNEGCVTASGKAWNARALRVVLMNPHTAGLRHVGGELVAGGWEAVLDRDTFDRVTVLLSDPVRRSSLISTRRHLLSGMLTCGACGGRMGIFGHVAGARYKCTDCGKVGIEAERTNAEVVGRLLSVLDQDRMAETFTADEAVDAVALLETDLADLAGDFGAGRISRREWVSAREALEERLVKARSLAIQQTETVTTLGSLRGENVRDSWESFDLPTKRSMIYAATKSITVRPYVRGANRWDLNRIEVEWRI